MSSYCGRSLGWVAGLVGSMVVASCSGSSSSTGLHPSSDLTAAIDWHMQPHFPGMDAVAAPPPAPTSCPAAPPGHYTEGPFSCTDGAGNTGCRYAFPTGKPLDFQSTSCLIQCTPGTVASCRMPCGSAGIEVCRTDGSWGACAAYEICDGIDNDCNGLVDDLGVCQTPLSAWDPQHGYGWDVWLDGCASTAKTSNISYYDWQIDVQGLSHRLRATECKTRFTFPAEGSYSVSLTITDALGRIGEVTAQVQIRNIVIASLGDSVASGEGNPDMPESASRTTPTWEDRRCHRSMLAAHAQVARRLEDADDHTSVTFTFLSCSGAGIQDGLIGPYQGEEIVTGDLPTMLPPQISELHRIMTEPRPIDVLLLQIGANDVGFGHIVNNCAYPTLTVPDMGDVLTCANDNNTKNVAAAIADLELTRYPALAATLLASLRFDVSRVYISEYMDLTHGDDGSFCSEIRLPGAITDNLISLIPDPSSAFLSATGLSYFVKLGADGVRAAANQFLSGADLTDGVISEPEITWAHDEVIVPLNSAIQRAAAANGWTFVPGEVQSFATHGYCANAHWITRYEESKVQQGNVDGTMHPNMSGHGSYADLLLAAVSRDLSRGSSPVSFAGGSPDADIGVGGDIGADGGRTP